MPQVRGLLYDLVFTKVAEGTNEPLPGAVFKLQQQDENGAWFDVVDSSGDALTATSDENGQVSFTDLQYGTYRAVETQAPTGYKATDVNGKALTWAPSAALCWTTNSKSLVKSTAASENAMAAESATATVANTRSMGLMVLKVDGNNSPLSGVTFTLTNNNDGSTASALTESKTVTKDSASTAESVAAASFATLDSGTYTLAESRVVAGYEVSSQSPYAITVNASGATVSNSSGQPVALNTLTCDRETFYYLTVTNYTLPALPETGGFGGICTYAIGSAALLLGLRRIARRHGRGRHATKI